jgi:hypothetical protein
MEIKAPLEIEDHFGCDFVAFAADKLPLRRHVEGPCIPVLNGFTHLYGLRFGQFLSTGKRRIGKDRRFIQRFHSLAQPYPIRFPRRAGRLAVRFQSGQVLFQHLGALLRIGLLAPVGRQSVFKRFDGIVKRGVRTPPCRSESFSSPPSKPSFAVKPSLCCFARASSATWACCCRAVSVACTAAPRESILPPLPGQRIVRPSQDWASPGIHPCDGHPLMVLEMTFTRPGWRPYRLPSAAPGKRAVP